MKLQLKFICSSAIAVALVREPAKRELWLEFSNEGSQAAVFQVYAAGGTSGPWTYTVGPGKQLSDYWSVEDAAGYDLVVRGPNGFHREFRGSLAASLLAARSASRSAWAIRTAASPTSSAWSVSGGMSR